MVANLVAMIFRKARPEEAEALTDLAIRSKRSWGYSDEFMQKVMPDMIVHSKFLEEENGIVAEDGDTTVGYAIVRVDSDQAFLRDLFVEPSYQRTGIGKALFAECTRIARAAGAVRIRLFGDPNAAAFYERLGMRKIGDEPSIAGGGRTTPVMVMDIETPER